MKLAALKLEGTEQAAIEAAHGYVTVQEINRSLGTAWSPGIGDILKRGEWAGLRRWYGQTGASAVRALKAIPAEAAVPAPLFRTPGKIIGIGMNYVEKLTELQGNPDEPDPVFFLKPGTSLIGPGDPIRLPPQAGRITAEAELAVIISARASHISPEEAPAFTAGFTPAVDVTAADILLRNPRFMARAKAFDTFFTLGSQLYTADEWEDADRIKVKTRLNGVTVHGNTAGHMRFPPWFLVSYLSKVMTLQPGDIIMTGTPGSAAIQSGDRLQCAISGFSTLENPVI